MAEDWDAFWVGEKCIDRRIGWRLRLSLGLSCDEWKDDGSVDGNGMRQVVAKVRVRTRPDGQVVQQRDAILTAQVHSSTHCLCLVV